MRSRLLSLAFVIAGTGPSSAQVVVAPGAVPGVVQGTGTTFQVRDSDYRSVTLDTSAPVTARVASACRTVLVTTEALTGESPVRFTLGRLAPSATYFGYRDTYENGAPVTTDEDGRITWVEDVSAPHAFWIQPLPGTTVLRDDATGGDCASIGSWNARTKTCTLTADVSGSVDVRSDGVTLDGAGHAITGWFGHGIALIRRTGVTIRDVTVSGFLDGIYLFGSDGNTVTRVVATEDGTAVAVLGTSRGNQFDVLTTPETSIAATAP